MSSALNSLVEVYDSLADDWDGPFARKPYDRARLEALAHRAPDSDLPILDLGCGLGDSTDHLARQGRKVVGIDLSPRLVARARERFPNVTFEVGDQFTARPAAGLVSFYSLIHEPRAELLPSVRSLVSLCSRGAPILVALFDGEGEASLEVGPRRLPITLYRRKEVEGILSEIPELRELRVEGRRPYAFERPAFRIFASAVRA
ncbi:MAG: methyltransferase domain-containing protein [Deltaproteobacteria bacterium]|nr:methyltransferase domain-containing protein [Deltaproteobacteria bacterium]